MACVRRILVLLLVTFASTRALAADESGGPTGLGHIRDDEPALTLTPTSSESVLELSPRGALQVRGALPFQDPLRFSHARGDLTESRGFVLRRLRLGLDATLVPQITMAVSSDLVDDSTPADRRSPLVVAYANLDARLFQLRAGLMRLPFTRHGLVDETRQVFLEPPVAWRADRTGLGPKGALSVLPDRRVGFGMHEDYGIASFGVGLFSGGLFAPESGSSLIFAGRVEVTPWLAPPLEGAYFKGDYEADAPRVAFALGGMGRSGPDGTSRAGSASVTVSYRGLYIEAEGVLGASTQAQDDSSYVVQRALVLDVAYRFPVLTQGLEFGLRGDLWSTSTVGPVRDPLSELRGLWVVANLYVWRHRIKASTLLHATGALNATGTDRARQEGIVELTVGF